MKNGLLLLMVGFMFSSFTGFDGAYANAADLKVDPAKVEKVEKAKGKAKDKAKEKKNGKLGNGTNISNEKNAGGSKD